MATMLVAAAGPDADSMLPPALAQLRDQLLPYYNQLASYIPSPDLHAQAIAANYASRNVQPLTMSNHRDILEGPDGGDGDQEWTVFVTGGNRTCHGKCGQIERAWNVRTLLSQDTGFPFQL